MPINHYNKFKVAPAIERTMDGILFASKKEMKRYAELKLLQRAGEITELELQPFFELLPKLPGKSAVTYKADFRYLEVSSGKRVVEEVKGFVTRDYRIRARLFTDKFPEYDYRIIR